jgi:hypothetical protein
MLFPVGNVIRISSLIFRAFLTGTVESSTNTKPAVLSLRIKFLFVPLLYEVISTIELWSQIDGFLLDVGIFLSTFVK